jgi:hypothetical protein
MQLLTAKTLTAFINTSYGSTLAQSSSLCHDKSIYRVQL